MYPPIFEVCSADPTVQSLLGTNPCNLYLFGMAPQGVSLPYSTWQTVGGSPENYINERPDIDGFTLQINCWASTATKAREVAKALANSIESDNHATITAWYGDSRDPETKNYGYSFAVDWFVPRA